MRTARRWAALVLAAALCVACSSIPTTGEVQEGDGSAGEPGQVIPQGSLPGQDASPEEILRGFLAALPAGINSAHQISREYLTALGSSRWEPWRSVTVYRSDPRFTIVSTTTKRVVYAVSMSVAGWVDEQGLFTETSTQAEREFEFVLQRDAEGQWRIDELPDGVLLNQSNFANLFRSVTLYFPTPDRSHLVPDVRWYVRETAATFAVRTLLESGPAPWLRDAVTTAHLGSTRLEGESVLVDATGTAVVELSASFMDLPRADQALVLAQIEAVLTRGSSSGVSEVQVQVQGVQIAVPADDTLLRDPAPDGSLLALDAEGFVVALGPDGLERVDGVVQLDPERVSAIAQGAGGFPLVAVDGRDLVDPRGEGLSEPWLEGRRLVAPSVDRHGWVWTSPERNAGRLLAARSRVEAVEVVAEWLEGREVRSLRVARDGARIVVVSSGEEGVTVDVAAVLRDDIGRPQRIGAPHQVGAVLTEAREAVWVDESTLAVLGSVAGASASAVQMVPVDGLTTSRGAPGGGSPVVHLAAGKGDRTLHVATEDGALWQWRAASWEQVATGVWHPAFPG